MGMAQPTLSSLLPLKAFSATCPSHSTHLLAIPSSSCGVPTTTQSPSLQSLSPATRRPISRSHLANKTKASCSLRLSMTLTRRSSTAEPPPIARKACSGSSTRPVPTCSPGQRQTCCLSSRACILRPTSLCHTPAMPLLTTLLLRAGA